MGHYQISQKHRLGCSSIPLQAYKLRWLCWNPSPATEKKCRYFASCEALDQSLAGCLGENKNLQPLMMTQRWAPEFKRRRTWVCSACACPPVVFCFPCLLLFVCSFIKGTKKKKSHDWWEWFWWGLNTYKPRPLPTGAPKHLSLRAALTRLFSGGDVLLIIKAVAGGAARLNFL